MKIFEAQYGDRRILLTVKWLQNVVGIGYIILVILVLTAIQGFCDLWSLIVLRGFLGGLSQKWNNIKDSRGGEQGNVTEKQKEILVLRLEKINKSENMHGPRL